MKDDLVTLIGIIVMSLAIGFCSGIATMEVIRTYQKPPPALMPYAHDKEQSVNDQPNWNLPPLGKIDKSQSATDVFTSIYGIDCRISLSDDGKSVWLMVGTNAPLGKDGPSLQIIGPPVPQPPADVDLNEWHLKQGNIPYTKEILADGTSLFRLLPAHDGGDK